MNPYQAADLLLAKNRITASEPPSATLSRALIDANGGTVLEVVADGSLVASRSKKTIVDATGAFDLPVGTSSGTLAAGDDYRLNRSLDVRLQGASPTATATANKLAIQATIDAAAAIGGSVYIAECYPCDAGLILREGVHLAGSHNTPKSVSPADGSAAGVGKLPKGGTLIITDTSGPFLRVQSGTSIDNLFFYHVNQPIMTATPAASLVTYPPTIVNDPSVTVVGVTIRGCTFQGGTRSMDFFAANGAPGCESILIDDCRGWPLGPAGSSPTFISFNNITDVPRVTNCQVNPGIARQLVGFPSNAVMDYVASQPLWNAFYVNNSQAFVFTSCFVFAQGVAFCVTGAAYGEITSCEADMVNRGVVADNGGGSLGYVNVIGFQCVLGAGVGPRIGYEATNGSRLRLVSCQTRLGTNGVIASSANNVAAYPVYIVDAASTVEMVGCGCLADSNFSFAGWVSNNNGALLIESGSNANTLPVDQSVSGLVRNPNGHGRAIFTVAGNHPAIATAPDGSAKITLADLGASKSFSFCLLPNTGQLALVDGNGHVCQTWTYGQ